MQDLSIKTGGLSKSFEGFVALDNITMQVASGSVFGLVGPNGAGKTTLIKIFMDIIRPDSGSVELLGQSSGQTSRIRGKVGYVPDIPGMYPNFKCEEMFRLGSKLYPDWDWEHCQRLSRAFEVPANKRIHNLSRGMKVRMSLIMALSIRPQLLLLDEPTAGLDPVFRRQFLQMVMDEAALSGTTVFYSTHNLTDLERTADTIGCLNRGRLLFQRPLDEIKESIHRVQFVTEDDQAMVPNLPGILDYQKSGRTHIMTVEGDWAEVETALNRLCPVYQERLDLSLEDAFISLIKKDIGNAASLDSYWEEIKEAAQ